MQYRIFCPEEDHASQDKAYTVGNDRVVTEFPLPLENVPDNRLSAFYSTSKQSHVYYYLKKLCYYLINLLDTKNVAQLTIFVGA